MEFDPRQAPALRQQVTEHAPKEPTLRVKALESLLVAKGLLDSAAVDAWIDVYRDEIGPKSGARVIARAWCDAAFRERLLADGTSAVQELGLGGRAVDHLKAVENTASRHNLVVCTLCSCYPFGLLGVQPGWYKQAAYRSRAVRDPRGVLEEFGEEIPIDVQIHVWDSTAELRYLVIPQRPDDSTGMNEDELARLVTRNSMIGTQRTLTIATGEA